MVEIDIHQAVRYNGFWKRKKWWPIDNTTRKNWPSDDWKDHYVVVYLFNYNIRQSRARTTKSPFPKHLLSQKSLCAMDKAHTIVTSLPDLVSDPNLSYFV